MAAAVYIKTINQNRQIKVSLLASKTKVAPLKRQTIPRLELSAAVILAKLTSKCIQLLNLQLVPCYLWADSSIVYTWINNHPSKWKDFVQNRVYFIQQSLPNGVWRHVPGDSNPSDCATRGLSATELKDNTFWWSGPPWLHEDPSNWPTLSGLSSGNLKDNLEERVYSFTKSHHVTVQLDLWDLIHRYSSLRRLFKVTALCRRSVARFKNRRATALDLPLTPEEIHESQLYWIRHIQQHFFSTEVDLLSKGSELLKGCSLVPLVPFLDDRGLLRVGGRLKHALIPDIAKQPYIIPKYSALSSLIVQDAHERTLHGSTQTTLCYIRNTYWITGGRIPVRSFILKCVKCAWFRKNHARHLIGQLPATRVNPSRAFLHSGVDYAGPYTIKSWKGRNPRTYKCYVALFVCFSTTAIHLELVSEYTADAFIAAYKRFTSRRGICATLTSDCGTNFKGADRELKQLFAQSSKELSTVASLIAGDGTRWSFHPPAAPHFGGKWEAGVRSMKHHL